MVNLSRSLGLGLMLAVCLLSTRAFTQGGEGIGIATVSSYVDAQTSAWEITVEGDPGSSGTVHFTLQQSVAGASLIHTSMPILFDVAGKSTISLPFDDLVTLFGPFRVGIYVETTDPLGQSAFSLVHGLECCDIPVSTYGLYSPAYSQWWYQTPEGGSTAYLSSLATYVRTNPGTGALDQYLFYSAPLIVWQTCPGIEGLLPVN